MQKSGKIAVIASVLIVLLLVIAFVFAKPSTRAVAACKDGTDNDGDGYTDWPADPGCSSKNDNSELNLAIECDDGTDNDGDSAIDMNDNGCSSPTDNDETDCGDGVCEGGETSGNCPADCGISDSCSDSDGGLVTTIQGTISGYLNNVSYNDDDYCVDSNNVMEYYCSGDYENNQQISCGTDNYTNNYCYEGNVYRDYIDRFCSSGACDSSSTPELIEECYYGCTNGECDSIPDSCSDTDGFDLTTVGTIEGYDDEEWYSYDDYCVDNETVYEHFCYGIGGSNPGGMGYNCASENCGGTNCTECSNGACI